MKMEGHESSDWNSYYADTQEVRGGQQTGRSRSSCWERPGKAGAVQGGRLADWGRLRGATTARPPCVVPAGPWLELAVGSTALRGCLGPSA